MPRPITMNRKQTRCASVAILVVACITLLLGVVAVALDGGMLQDNKRLVQNTADSAAWAAANVLYANYSSISSVTPDPGSAASTAAQNNATTNGFPNNNTTSKVTVNIPPTSGPFRNSLGYAEVIVTYYQPAYFASIWGTGTTQVQARAVARGSWVGTGNGVIVLDPTAKDALNSAGGASLTVSGGAAMIVDSNNAEAARATGGGTLTANQFNITGGYTGSLNGTVTTGTMPIADPLAYLPAPSGLTNGTVTTTSIGNGNSQYVITPGIITNMPQGQTGDIFIFKQASYNSNGGIYYINGGGFKSSGATIQMDALSTGGVMIYNNPASTASSEGINIAGNSAGSITLSALSSGPYAGILLWQNRSSTVGMSVAGQGSFNLTGTFYTANAQLQVSGNGVATIGSQYISRTLTISGNGGVNINYTDNGTARKRDIRLVE